MKAFEQVRDLTKPLEIKKLNDQLMLLWEKVRNIDTKDIRNGAVTLNKLASDVGQSLDLSSNESISLRISDIDIGGRNLVKNTSNEYSDAIHSEYYARIGTVVLSDVGLKPGDQITYSVYVKAHAEFGERLRIRWHNESGSNHANSYSEEALDPGAEGRLTLTAIIPDGTVNFYLALSAIPTGTVFTSQYKELKLERGNKATDWTPAPEDMVAKKNLITEINLAPGTVKIQSDKINLVGAVTVLSDITGNLGTITAGTITGATVRTSSGTSRIELSSNLLRSYLNGVRRVQLDYDSLDFYTSDNRLGGEVVASVDSLYNLPVISVQSSDGMVFLQSRKSSTNYAQVYASAYQGVDDDEALVGIDVRRGNNEGNIEVGPGAVFITGSEGSNVSTLVVAGQAISCYGPLDIMNGLRVQYPTGKTVNALRATTASGRETLHLWSGSSTNNGGAINLYSVDDTNVPNSILMYAGGDYALRLDRDGKCTIYKDTLIANGKLNVKALGSYNIVVDDNAGGYTDVTIRPSSGNHGNLGSGTYYWNNAYSAKWNQGSQRSLKENIQLYDEELAYEQLKDIPIYTYSFKNDQFTDHNIGTMIDYMPIEILDTTRLGRTEEGEIGMWASGSAIFFLMAVCKVLQKKVEELELRLEGVLS